MMSGPPTRAISSQPPWCANTVISTGLTVAPGGGIGLVEGLTHYDSACGAGKAMIPAKLVES